MIQDSDQATWTMLKKARKKEIANINPVRLLQYTEQWRPCGSTPGINLGILFSDGITQDKWQAFINTFIYSLSDEVIEQVRQAASTHPMQAAYATVRVRHKCYKGAERTHQTDSGSALYNVGSYTP
eukprot:744457-Karenia_brevis.AAC.1